MNSLLRFVPAPLIRLAGRLQFKFPFLKGIINSLGQSMAGKGIIQRGPGQGLHFDATGCNPGYLAGTSEPLEQELVSRYSKPGGVVYDVGANAGFYAILAARGVGATGKVFAFEPAPALARRTRENGASNGFSHLEVVEAAVSDHDGEVNFEISGELSVTNQISEKSSATTVKIPAIALDDFCQDHPDPDLIMLDIEGAEIHALKGALGMIARKKPVMLIEVHWLGKIFPDFVDAHLKPLGYRATTYDGQPFPDGPVRYHALLLPPGA